MTVTRRQTLQLAAGLGVTRLFPGEPVVAAHAAEPIPAAPLDSIIVMAKGTGSDYVFSTWPGDESFTTTRFDFPRPQIEATLPRTLAVARFELAVAELVTEMNAAVPLPG